jgi:hypothetical protein
MRGCIAPIFVLAAAFLSSCEKEADAELRAKVVALEAAIEELRDELKNNDFMDELQRDSIAEVLQAPAGLSGESTGYSIARTQFGPFPVLIEGVSPYLDGYKAKIKIGNMTSARFQGAKINVKWQLPLEKDTPYKVWQESKKEKEFSVTKVFPPGTYTLVEVALTPATPAEIRNLSIHLDFNQMSLLMGQKAP